MTTAELVNDIPLDAATAAYTGSSFNPEKRGESLRQGYAEELAGVYEELSAKCRNESETAALAAWWPRFRSAMRQLHLDYLRSQSGIVSTMIAGPSNFPVRQMEKRNRWANNKLEHLLDVKARMLKRINRDLRPELRPIMSGDSDAVQRLTADIEQAEKLQATMKACNHAIRSQWKNGEAAVIAALVALGRSEALAREMIQPGRFGGMGFASFELTNNGANIRRMKQRLEVIKRNQSAKPTEIQGEHARVEDSPAENRVRLFFHGKPSEEVRTRLKRSGFRWSPTIGAWQAYRNYQSMETAKREAGLTNPTND